MPEEETQAARYLALTVLVGALRESARGGGAAVDATLRESTQRLGADPAYAGAIFDDLRLLLGSTDPTHLLSEAGILSDEGIASGVVRRIGGRLAPAPPRSNNLEQQLVGLFERRDERWIAALSLSSVQAWIDALCRDRSSRWDGPAELASAIVILATRIAGAGLDARILARVPELAAWDSPFLALSRISDDYAESVVSGACDADTCRRAIDVVERCRAQVEAFRAQHTGLGTSFELSSRSLRMKQQLRRLRLLIDVLIATDAPSSGADGEPGREPEAIATLTVDLVLGALRGQRILGFVLEKIDLVAYLVVGHAAKKGEKYVVRTARGYRSFLFKSTLAGLIVAVFACAKIHLSHDALAPLPQGLLYGANYALCFALIYWLGATLATKQPAMTASRLAHALETNPQGEDFARLVRAVWRSQFVSFVGNILGASVFAIVIAVSWEAATGAPLVSAPEATKLVDQLHPWRSPSLFYAAIAGVLLSSAGFLAGFVDNAVVFHRVAERISSGAGVFRILPLSLRRHLAARIDNELGALTGNVSLGFMLGTAGTVGAITGLPFDIRHIAFASSHATLGLFHLPALQTVGWIATLLAAVLLIGLVNFLVSFGLTLGVAVESRKVIGVKWRHELRLLARLALRRPLHFFFPFPDDPSEGAVQTPPPGA